MVRSSRKNRDISARRRRAQEKGLPWAYIVPAIIVIIVIGLAAYVETRQGTNAATTDYVLAPNVANPSFPFSCLGTESLFMHIHPWLRIVIDGINVTIPAAIGIENPVPGGSSNFGEVYGGGASSCFEPVHTHDFSGVIHIESSTNTNYTLQEFFQIWAQTYQYAYFNGTNQKRPIVFNSTDILGFQNNATYHVVLLVDGKVNTDYGGLVLNTLAYCSSGAPYNQPSNPCSATADGTPAWNGGQAAYPYGTGHTIEIEYVHY